MGWTILSEWHDNDPYRRAAAIESARQLAPVLVELKSSGMLTRRMAAEFTTRGVQTPNGTKWHGNSQIPLRFAGRKSEILASQRDQGECRSQ